MNLPAEQQAIRAKCFHPSATFVEFPKADAERSIPERFEKIARQYPDRVAIKTRDEALTYEELNARANRLAHELLATRSSVPEPVALYLDDWSDLVVAHMAVLKAGKFSVALDPLAEADRSTHIVNDCGVRVMIVDEHTSAVGAKLVSDQRRIVSLTPFRSGPSETNPQVSIPAEANAYLRYTSGSTGNAKGAIKTHRHVLRETMDFINEFHLCPADVVTNLGLSIGNTFSKHCFAGRACLR